MEFSSWNDWILSVVRFGLSFGVFVLIIALAGGLHRDPANGARSRREALNSARRDGRVVDSSEGRQ